MFVDKCEVESQEQTFSARSSTWNTTPNHNRLYSHTNVACFLRRRYGLNSLLDSVLDSVLNSALDLMLIIYSLLPQAPLGRYEPPPPLGPPPLGPR